MKRFVFVVCFYLSVACTAASSSEREVSVDKATMEYLIRRIEVLENREAWFREELAVVRKKQERQGKEIVNLRRLLGDRTWQKETQGKDVVTDDQKRSDTYATEAHSTDGGQISSDDRKQRIRQSEVDVNVAFFSTLSTDSYHLGKNQILAFDHIETNEGNAYNPHTGAFIAPVPGTYVFSTTVTTKERSIAHFAFTLNGRSVTTMYVNGVESWYESSTQTIVLKLHQGDEVSIIHTDSDKNIAGGHFSIFSGFLLRQSIASSNIVG